MLSVAQLEDLAEEKTKAFKKFLEAQPPEANGEDILELWEEVYDEEMRNVVVRTETGPSDDATNPVFPYEKLQAVIKDGGNWKWPRMWQKFDEIERRGACYRDGEKLHFGMPNKNPNIVPQRCLVVGGGPVGLRLAIELVMGGHQVTVFEKRREKKAESGALEALGFTNRINRPHMWPFVRNDLAKLNGKDLLNRQACYPVFTEPETSSIGIDELQCLLLKNALLLGVDFRLGVGYVDAKVRTDGQSMMPTWEVECTYDAGSAEKFEVEEGTNKQIFDCLIGCDGPRSAVRDTQAKHFGEIEKRKFMDSVGIVANVRKVSKARLKEMNFAYGQEPGDMNRTKMVFKVFFAEIEAKADADIETLIYYKACTHNYTILVPKRQDLIKHGLSGKVYHFAAGREMATQRDEDKEKLKSYCRKVLTAAGIPIDEKLPNGGFVDAPNDCMAFDFAECWNTKKSIVFNLPPPGYDVEADGPWMGRKLIPLVALCGDALLEPFWPLGLGLKRGWQAIMDTCYAIDNIFNRELYAEKLGKDPETFSWEDHYEAHKEQIGINFELCNRLKISNELGKGEYDPKGVVLTQLMKKVKDIEKPSVEVEIDPWTRYEPLAKERDGDWKLKIQDDTWMHPKVQKVLNMREYYNEICKGGKNGELQYEGKKLISVDGRVLPGFARMGTKTIASAPAPAPASALGARASLAQALAQSHGPRASLAQALTQSQGQNAGPRASLAQALTQNQGPRASLALNFGPGARPSLVPSSSSSPSPSLAAALAVAAPAPAPVPVAVASSPAPPEEAHSKFKVGDRVLAGTRRDAGTVRFVGLTKFQAGIWVGVELDNKKLGKNDGTVQGVSYFTCPDKTGIFIREAMLVHDGDSAVVPKPPPVTRPVPVAATKAAPAPTRRQPTLGGRSSILGGGPNLAAAAAAAAAAQAAKKEEEDQAAAAPSGLGTIGNSAAAQAVARRLSATVEKRRSLVGGDAAILAASQQSSGLTLLPPSSALGCPASLAANALLKAPVMATAFPLPGGGFTPGGEAELLHIRSMILGLSKSLETYQKVERDLLARAR